MTLMTEEGNDDDVDGDGDDVISVPDSMFRLQVFSVRTTLLIAQASIIILEYCLNTSLVL